MRAIAGFLLGAAFLAGCAPKLTEIHPYAAIVFDPSQFAADQKACAAGKPYTAPFDVAGMGEAAASAGAKATPQAAVAPLAIPLSAVGAAGSQAIEGLGLTHTEQIRAYLLCVDRLTEWDKSAVVADPRK